VAPARTACRVPESGRQPGQAPRAVPARRGVFGHSCHSAAAFAALVVIAQARDGRVGQLDRTALRVLQARRRPAGVSAARAVSILGEPAFVSPLLAVFAVMVSRRAGWRAACAPFLAVASGAAVRRRLSRAIARPRPPAAGWLTEPEGFSMPSKHTTLAALAAGACVGSAGARGLPRHGVPLLAAAGVGTSRVYLGVHWPSDIVAGWLFAEGWLALAGSVATGRAGRHLARAGRRRSGLCRCDRGRSRVILRQAMKLALERVSRR